MSLDSTLPDLSSDEAAFAKLKFIIEKTIIDLNNMDAVDVGLSQNESLRSFKAKLKHVLQNWKNYEDLTVKEPWQELIDVLKEFKAIEKTVISYDAVVIAAKDSKSEFVFGKPFETEYRPAHVEQVSVEEWPAKMSAKRRQSQIEAHLLSESSLTQNFCTQTPTFYSCCKCMSNDHSYKYCSRSSTCATCKLEGHIAKDCEYSLCVHCQIYGHTRPVCPDIDKPAVCHKCGEPGHIAIYCQSFDYRHCRLCGGKHFMVYCDRFNGKCYKHFGAHMYLQCPDYLNKKLRSRFYE
uniref:CCHC-type domain-containing protein n=1 Tax=Panagrolaimus davidi TaxID=227884 RepID=A0A914PRV9_9BILA